MRTLGQILLLFVVLCLALEAQDAPPERRTETEGETIATSYANIRWLSTAKSKGSGPFFCFLRGEQIVVQFMHYGLGTRPVCQEVVAAGVICVAVGVDYVSKAEVLFLQKSNNSLHVSCIPGRVNSRRLKGFFTTHYVAEYFHLAHCDLFNDHDNIPPNRPTRLFRLRSSISNLFQTQYEKYSIPQGSEINPWKSSPPFCRQR